MASHDQATWHNKKKSIQFHGLIMILIITKLK